MRNDEESAPKPQMETVVDRPHMSFVLESNEKDEDTRQSMPPAQAANGPRSTPANVSEKWKKTWEITRRAPRTPTT